MDNRGDLAWYSVFTGTNPVSTAKAQDRCFGITYNIKEHEVTVLLQIKMTELRSSQYKKADFYDTALILMDMNGRPKKATTISFSDVTYNIYLANNALLTARGYYYWAGWSYGFSTRAPQKLEKPTTTQDFDVFTFKYKWDMDYYTCLWEMKFQSSAIRSVQTIYGRGAITQ